MKTIYDVQQLLKRYGTFIYIGDRLAELELMEEEVKELYQAGFISITEFQQAMVVLRQEVSKWRKR